MKRLTLFCTLFCFLLATPQAQPKYELRAVWLTTIGGIDWPSTYAHDGMGAERQKQELCLMLDRMKSAGINTVLLQTRVRATTIYPSNIEPWDGCMSGKPGQSPGYDPLQFAIDECHRRGMELHAWVVTIPVGKWQTFGCQQLRRRFPSLIKKIGDEGYMNPESAQTADYIADICEEITRRYDVDGIHLDYIRYPETWKGAKRKDNITRIVQRIHQKVKLYKPWVKLSCSPIGKYDDLSRYSSRGWNANRQVAQDAQGWLRQGLMDQLYPMMYFKGNNFYPFAIDWQEQSCGHTIASGLGVYMLHPREGNWPLNEVKRQLNVTRQVGMGHCFFRAKFLLDNVKGVYDYVGLFDRMPALIPPMTWANIVPPTSPTVLNVEHTPSGDNLSWHGARDYSDAPYLLYNVYASTDEKVDISNPANLIATRKREQQLTLKRKNGKRLLHYAVTALDRYGNESMPVFAAQGGQQSAERASAMLANDGKWLDLTMTTDADYLAVSTLQGAIIHTCPNRPRISITAIPEGIYELKSLNRKGISHRLGFFIVRRGDTK
ncbi:MAG: family 10 glycosylhydrolase [Prevotella sp.]|nr:family 10 glycosylhydrolase [Prevotella sp.]MBQ9654772.1 family 10 glycosylhydrolase [Prevotella sp.]MBR1506250.1 family 10 glycosylhydrolase [Prevotella sp.]